MSYQRVFKRTAMIAAAITGAVSGAAVALESASPTATQVTGDYPAINLLNGSADVLGRPFEYPDCPPDIHAVTITMAPGQVGKEHQHLTPLFAYVLSGEIAVTYHNGAGPNGEGLTRVYRAGDALMEAMHVMHRGFNPGDEPVTLLAVYMNCAQ